jgi:hypothetical protein
MLKKPLCIAIILTIFSFVLSSCESDPLIPPVETGGFDSARYDYTVDTLNQFIRDIGGVDTNRIYLLTDNSLMIFDGTQYTTHLIPDPTFSPGFLGIVGTNQIYIGGGNNSPQPQSQRLLKWDGVSFSEIDIPNGPQQNISIVYAFSENEIWLCGHESGVTKYDGNSFNHYGLDSDYVIRPVFKVNGQVYCYGYKMFGSATYSENYHNIYKFENNNWTRVFQDTTLTGEAYDVPIPFWDILNDNLIARLSGNLYQFNGSEYYSVHSTNELSYFYRVGGSSVDNILSFAGSYPDEGIYHWNGNKWSVEINFPYNPTLHSKIIGVENNYYMLLHRQGRQPNIFTFIPKVNASSQNLHK